VARGLRVRARLEPYLPIDGPITIHRCPSSGSTARMTASMSASVSATVGDAPVRLRSEKPQP
jgi:hypothetical protein